MTLKKLIVCSVVICMIYLCGFNSQICGVSNNDETDFWGVVVVSLQETKEPYIYNSLIESDNWKPDNIRLLWRENSTKENILDSIEWLADNADSNDFVLFSVDCHGTYYDGEYGIWPWDGDDNGVTTVSELDNRFDTINANGMCLIFDCCFSGSFVEKSNIFQNDLIHKNFLNPIFSPNGMNDENRVIIMSTMPEGLGCHWIDPILDIEKSPTSMLSEALSNNYDENNDGITSAEEGFSYLKKNYLRWALKGFFLISAQIVYFLTMGFFIKPFPTIYDSYNDQLPIILKK